MKHTRYSSIAIVVAIICLIFLSACARRNRRTAHVPQAPQPSASVPQQPSSTAPQPSGRAPGESPAHPSLAVPIGYAEEGVASWYGVPFHGRPAADGEIYDMEKLVAAHRLLPFNTWLKVTNLTNNKSVTVRVIDRGPFVNGRIIDLSRAAARDINLIGPGTARVRLQVVAAPIDNPSTDFYAVQIGAFSVYDNAVRLRAQYAQRFGSAQIAVKEGRSPVWRVLVGKEPSIQAAQQLASVLSTGSQHVFVVRLDQTAITPNANIAPLPAASTSNAVGNPGSRPQ